MPARIGWRGIAPRSGWMVLGSATGNFRWCCVKSARAGVLLVITKAKQTNDTANQRHSKPTTRQTNSTANQRLPGSMNPNRRLQIQKQLQRRLPKGGRYRVNVWVRRCNTRDQALVGLRGYEDFRSAVRGGVG